jgi:hypothetical protein
MWANKLKSTDNTFKVVYINAWESDFQGDPLLAIVSYLLEVLKPSEDIEPIKETAGKLCKFALSVGNDVVQRFTGVDVIKAGQYAESEKDTAKTELGLACFQLYQERHKLFEKLKDLLRDLTDKSDLPILLIIDELDRCRPNYAIEFLETIKHFFDIRRLVFVIGVDKGQLASSAKALFGQELVFDEYYRKFAHRDVNLPVKSQPMTENFCRKLVVDYLSKEAFGNKNRFPYAKHDNYRTDDIVNLCLAFSLNARQMHEFFRTTAHVLSTVEKSDRYLLWGCHVGTFFMTALSIKNRELYDQIGRREISLSKFTESFKNLSLFKDDSLGGGFWWAELLYLGVFSEQPTDKLKQEFQKLGVWESSNKEENAFENKLSKFGKEAYGRFGNRDPVFLTIYQTLEGLRTFASK